jgi:hypothetical protein
MPRALPTDPDSLTDLRRTLVQNQGLWQEVNLGKHGLLNYQKKSLYLSLVQDLQI